MKILEYIKEKLKSKYKEKYETLKKDMKDIANYFSPIGSYFRYKGTLDDKKTPDYMKKGIQNLLDMTEKECHEKECVKNIEEILRKNE